MIVHDEYVPWHGTNFDVCLVKMPLDIYETGMANAKKDENKTCVLDIYYLDSHNIDYDCTSCGDGCVNAACLPTEREMGGRACWVAGWGQKAEEVLDGVLRDSSDISFSNIKSSLLLNFETRTFQKFHWCKHIFRPLLCRTFLLQKVSTG